MTTTTQETQPTDDAKYHDYVGNDIPWYVRAFWIGFWIFAAVYTIRHLFPALQRELFKQ